MDRIQTLRALVNERLNAAAEEIFGLFEKTVITYEEEIHRQRKLLDMVSATGADSLHLLVCEEGVPCKQQEGDPNVGQEDPKSPQLKVEQEQLWTGQGGAQLQGLSETNASFSSTPSPLKRENNVDEKPCSLFIQTQTEDNGKEDPIPTTSTAQIKTEPVGEECAVSQQGRNVELISSTAIPLMCEQDVSKYTPRYGHRLAAVAVCRNNHRSDPETSRRSQLLERIRVKGSAPNSKAIKRARYFEKLKGNKNAKKNERRVEIGWINFSEKDNEFKQVRTPRGGGTKHVRVSRQTRVREIQEMAESLFFPDGHAKSLKVEDYDRGICDFSQNEIDQDLTVDDLYEEGKLKILRLYLYTKRHTQDKDSSSDTSQAPTSEVTGNVSQDFNHIQASEKEVITIDLSLLQESDVMVMGEEISNMQ